MRLSSAITDRFAAALIARIDVRGRPIEASDAPLRYPLRLQCQPARSPVEPAL